MQNLEQKLSSQQFSLRNGRIILGLLTLASILSWQSPLAEGGCRSGDAPTSQQAGGCPTNEVNYYWQPIGDELICCGPKK